MRLPCFRLALLPLAVAMAACAKGQPITSNSGGAGPTGASTSATTKASATTGLSSSTGTTVASATTATATATSGSTSTGMACVGSTKCMSIGDCPAPPSDCVAVACTLGCCAQANKPTGSTCNSSGGHLCDASAQCVGCLMNSDCSSGDCHTGSCYTCGGHGAQDNCCPNGTGNIDVTTLAFGQSIKSCDGRFTLTMQTDGNLVLYFNGVALWATNTNGCGDHAVMQGDGNFVVYAASNAPCWSSNTANNPGAFLTLQNDGNLVIYNGAAIWASNTGGH